MKEDVGNGTYKISGKYIKYTEVTTIIFLKEQAYRVSDRLRKIKKKQHPGLFHFNKYLFHGIISMIYYICCHKNSHKIKKKP